MSSRDKKEGWHPYFEYNGEIGSVVAIAGEKYAIVASDSRLSRFFSIKTRDQTKLFPMNDSMVLGVVGPWADVLALKSVLCTRMFTYELEFEKKMSLIAMAQMIQVTLYEENFLAFATLAGVDAEGKGCVYGYSPKGAVQQFTHHAAGSAEAIVMPFLDTQMSDELNLSDGSPLRTSLPKYKAMALLRDVFHAAAARDVFTGDSIRMSCITKNGVEEDTFSLRSG